MVDEMELLAHGHIYGEGEEGVNKKCHSRLSRWKRRGSRGLLSMRE